MSNSNPTALRLGATGALDGRRYTVVGRTVLSVVVDGETYYWNEFNLVDSLDNALTLVYEDAEDGSEWKLFKLFEPTLPMSVAEAATKQIGDWVNFGGVEAQVTLVDRSRIVFVEGRVPEGVATGVEAEYFNAENGDRMIVVSWSGDEVEYYDGRVASARRIEAAFGLPRAEVNRRGFFDWMANATDFSAYFVIAAAVIAMAVAGSFVYSARRNSESRLVRPVPEKRMASASPLPIGAAGVLRGKNFQIVARALVEVSRLGDRFDGYEYALMTPGNERELLIEALQGKLTDWYLLTPTGTPADLTPFAAASFRQGRPAMIGGHPMHVAQLFQIRVTSKAGDDSVLSWPVGMAHGFLAKSDHVDVDGSEWMLARWTETGIESYRIGVISDSDVKSGFGAREK